MKIYRQYIYITGKYKNLFVQAFETGRKANIWRALLPCFVVSANKFYIFRQFTYFVFILHCQKAPKQLPIV